MPTLTSRRLVDILATGPIVGNRPTAMDAPIWIDAIDPRRSIVGGTVVRPFRGVGLTGRR